jgi:hypothetical protein
MAKPKTPEEVKAYYDAVTAKERAIQSEIYARRIAHLEKEEKARTLLLDMLAAVEGRGSAIGPLRTLCQLFGDAKGLLSEEG